mmetsp:Transcript_13749/g.29107  ORF Transcript_13749/g.29107 Transcript_13749/m.29107 type:complete len:120 (+) Transcript_13749:95-454(+)
MSPINTVRRATGIFSSSATPAKYSLSSAVTRYDSLPHSTASYSDGPRSPSNNDESIGDERYGWQPNQTTVIFQRMEKNCPDVLKAYAKCVIEKQNSGALVQGACDEQFKAVMNCFRSVR